MHSSGKWLEMSAVILSSQVNGMTVELSEILVFAVTLRVSMTTAITILGIRILALSLMVVCCL